MVLGFRTPIQVLPNLGIKSSSAGEPKMEAILRPSGQVSLENNTLIIFESKNGSHLLTVTCSSAPCSHVIGHRRAVDHDPNLSLRPRLRHIT